MMKIDNVSLSSYDIIDQFVKTLHIIKTDKSLLRKAVDKSNLVMIKYINEQSKISIKDLKADNYYIIQSMLRNRNFELLTYFKDQVNLTKDCLSFGRNIWLQNIAKKGDLEFLRFLVDNFGFTIDDIDKFHSAYAFITWIIIYDHFDMFQYIITNFAITLDRITLRNENVRNHSIFGFCVIHDRLHMIKFIKEHLHLTAEHICKDNYYILHECVSQGHLDILQYFISDIPLIYNNDILLHIASDKGHFHIVQYLFETHDTNNFQSNYILEKAVVHDNFDIVTWITTSHNFDIDDIRSNDNYLVHTAADNGNLDMVTYFVEKYNLVIDDILSRCGVMSESYIFDEKHEKIIKYYVTKYGKDYNKIKDHCANNKDIMKYFKNYKYDHNQLETIKVVKRLLSENNIDLDDFTQYLDMN